MAQVTTTLDLMNLPSDPDVLKEIVRQLYATVTTLKHQLERMKRNQFGRKSERMNPAQLQLFIEQVEATIERLERPEPPAPPAASENGNGVKEGKGHGRKAPSKALPRKRIEYTIPDEELPCRSCGEMRVKIGEEVSEQIEYVPASLLVLEHVRFKYACKHCQEHVSVAPPVPKPIEKGLPGPGLLSEVVVAKYDDHLPLHRQEKIFARYGAEISRKTMGGWIREAASLLDPLYQAMKKGVLLSKRIHSDDTKVPVLDETREKTREGHIWTYLGDERAPYTVYDFTPNHTNQGPVLFLAGYRGFLQADAYQGYDAIFREGEVTEVGCWAHARRGFYDCQSSDSIRSSTAIVYIRKLYEVEREAHGLSPPERKALREARARPVLDDFKRWIDEQVLAVLPEAPIRKAIGYVLNQWKALNRYLEDGELEIDNNAAERALRAIAVGRKNWMFAGSDEGGRRAAVLYTVIETCKRNGVEPFRYLRHVFDRISTYPEDRLDDLLPHNWKRIQDEQARVEAATE